MRWKVEAVLKEMKIQTRFSTEEFHSLQCLVTSLNAGKEGDEYYIEDSTLYCILRYIDKMVLDNKLNSVRVVMEILKAYLESPSHTSLVNTKGIFKKDVEGAQYQVGRMIPWMKEDTWYLMVDLLYSHKYLGEWGELLSLCIRDTDEEFEEQQCNILRDTMLKMFTHLILKCKEKGGFKQKSRYGYTSLMTA